MKRVSVLNAGQKLLRCSRFQLHTYELCKSIDEIPIMCCHYAVEVRCKHTVNLKSAELELSSVKSLIPLCLMPDAAFSSN